MAPQEQSKQGRPRRRGARGGRGAAGPKSDGEGSSRGGRKDTPADADAAEGGADADRSKGKANNGCPKKNTSSRNGASGSSATSDARASKENGGRRPSKKSDGASARSTRNDRNPQRKNSTTKSRGKGKRSDQARKEEENKGADNADDASSHGQQKQQGKRKSRTKKVQYEPHASHSACLQRYSANDPTIVCGKIRVMPSRNGAAFVTCDRGSQLRDVLIKDEKARNRALDGDHVFVELLPALGNADGGAMGGAEKKCEGKGATIADYMTSLELSDGADGATTSRHVSEEDEEVEYEEGEYLIEENHQRNDTEDDEDEEGEMWHDDAVQMSLWDPAVNLRKKRKKPSTNEGRDDTFGAQRSGKVIFVVPPKSSASQQPSELTPEDESYRKKLPKRTIVGTLTVLPGQEKNGGRYLLVPNNKSLPRFMCPAGTKANSNDDADGKTLYRAEYVHASWHATNRWPPCTRVTRLCGTCNVEDETKALLVENGVDHGDFVPAVLRDVETSVKSGRFYQDGEMGWRPTEEMCRGRRDYRKQRIFTIDPTTAKDLDDALHITPLPDGRVEIGVHIADVSHFIQPKTAVDEEAQKRATTVYLVNGIVPMLPKPLCEIACSLNEDVERLAFSCVWKMNKDGTLSKKGGGKGKPKQDDIWYGRTVIKSCARLDYATAQNIIDGKVATGERNADEKFWPKSRQPTGGHTIDEVAADVRLMHTVAMARRKLRFENGALALNGIKLSFQLEDDGETPKLCAPYPIRDSNRLIEEFMLLANYLVAQRLITHAHGRALLRNHSPPIEQGMQQVVDVSKESLGFEIDTTNSSTLQESLSRLSRECEDELVVQCVTESLMTPMRPAEYMAAGELDEVEWQHFALNIPYYTHFTSPIRRYPDVIVHRLLQATLDDDVDDFPLKQGEIHAAAGHCNDMRMAAKKAQERSDRVFLSLYLKKHPIASTLGVCLGVGEKTLTCFVPSLGMSTRVFLDEHKEEFITNAVEDDNGKRRIVISPKTNVIPGMDSADSSPGPAWKSLNISVFTKLEVACTCKMGLPIDVRVKIVGPWTG
ncbi:hypothetical protein ACHAXT_005840 [Thalassiosira profunda]